MTAESGPAGHAVAPPADNAGGDLGWMLLVGLLVAVIAAISLAVQQSVDAIPAPSTCGGLYDKCCEDDERDWQVCPSDECDPDGATRSDGHGLFDAEDDFARRDHSIGCT